MDKNKSNEKTYVKLVRNRKGKWEEESTCRINAEQAELFNKQTKNTGEKYELGTESKADNKATTVKVGEIEYNPKAIIDVINAAALEEVNKLNANTGAVKVQALFDALSEEQKEVIQKAITLS